MKLPKKIYLQRNTTTDLYEELWPEWFEARSTEDDIEYIRSDVLRSYEYNEELAKYLTGLIAKDICISDYEREQIELALIKGNFGDVYTFVRNNKLSPTKPSQKELFKTGEIKFSKTTER